MLKKAIACLLVLAGVCSFHTSAADSKNEQFVNVNVFNKVSAYMETFCGKPDVRC